MYQMSIEMPLVSKCDITKCGYNVNNSCNAKAITIGDGSNPGCDTYLNTSLHCREANHAAGVGACKVNVCKHNVDFECTANNVSVGMNEGKINCLTFATK